MAAIVAAIIFAIIAIVGVVFTLVGSSDGKKIGGIVAVVGMLVATTVFMIGMYNKVPARNLGIVSNGGKVYDQTLAPGRHWLAPYKSVDLIDTTIQTIHFRGDKHTSDKGIDTEPSVGVQLSNKTYATIEVTVQWHVSTAAEDAVNLYKSYKHNGTAIMDGVRDNLVVAQIKHAMGLVYSNYNPLASLTDANANDAQVTNDDLEKLVIAKLTPLVPNIVIVSFTINLPHYDNTTQEQLNKYAQALAAQRIAEQQAKVNQAIVDANNILANAASSKDPGAQYQQCLQLLRDLATSGKLADLPPNTLSCGNGNNGSVIVGSK